MKELIHLGSVSRDTKIQFAADDPLPPDGRTPFIFKGASKTPVSGYCSNVFEADAESVASDTDPACVQT